VSYNRQHKHNTEHRRTCLPLAPTCTTTTFQAFPLILLFLNSLRRVLFNTGLVLTLLSKALHDDAITLSAFFISDSIGMKWPERWLAVYLWQNGKKYDSILLLRTAVTAQRKVATTMAQRNFSH